VQSFVGPKSRSSTTVAADISSGKRSNSIEEEEQKKIEYGKLWAERTLQAATEARNRKRQVD
jgi:hypothetical protein